MPQLRLLLVDDNPDDRDLVARSLRPDFGESEILHAYDATSFSAALDGPPCDVVITDFHLRWTDGLATLRASKERWPLTPVIMFTGTGNEEIAVEAMKAGLDDYVVKAPQHFARLTAATHTVLNRSRERRELGAAEARYRNLFTGVPVGLFSLSPRGDILDANPAFAQMAGFPNAIALQSINFGDLFADGEVYREWLRLLDERDVVNHFRALWRRCDSTDIWVECEAHALRDHERITGYEGSVENVSEQERAEVEVVRSFRAMREAVDGAVIAISTLSEWRDAYTAGHQQRVAQLSAVIAKQVCSSPVQRETVRVAAQLHDIGKVAVPLDILSKPSRLNSYEFELVKLHPQVGHDILHHISLPWPVADVVLQHHCRLDGSGYPEGLRGNAICLEARIIAVADVVEAMASHRPYRAALGVESALEEIRTFAGERYDADVVRACCDAFANGFTFAEPTQLHRTIGEHVLPTKIPGKFMAPGA
jgi:PAS domain S-box-containing protein